MGEGARGFGEDYWATAYAEPDRMDMVHNAEAHARLLRASFETGEGGNPVSSVVDLGFGLGVLFDAVLHAFRPYKALGIEPSAPAFDRRRALGAGPAPDRVVWLQEDLATWCRRPDGPPVRFDLGLCTSVLQYLDDDELQAVVPVLAHRVKWLYLTVPTDLELDEQAHLHDWDDPWAVPRAREAYEDALRPWFDRVGLRLLESRVRVGDRTPFTDRLFRGW